VAKKKKRGFLREIITSLEIREGKAERKKGRTTQKKKKKTKQGTRCGFFAKGRYWVSWQRQLAGFWEA
jgi:hypothetical protein